MDEDGSKQIRKIKKQGKEVSFLKRHVINVGDVFSSFGIRRTIQIDDGSNWLILGCRYNFLFNFRMFLVIVYLTYETFK